MNSTESLSFLKVMGDEDFDRESERRCLQSRHNMTKNSRLKDTIDWLKQSRYVCTVCLTLLFIVCGLSYLLVNNFEIFGLNKLNRKQSNEKQLVNVTEVDQDELPLSPFEQAVMVDTICGKLIGTVEDGAFAFKGIPYALPPTGTLRWSRPIPLWSDWHQCQNPHKQHRRVKHFGSSCVQFNPLNKKVEGNEDCLYLNIWTPRLDDSSNLEVMVWFHSGLLHYGSGHMDNLRPNGKLSRDSNFVFVSFNYRLQAMGFLALDLLANSGANSSFGNYGLWDSMVVLEWIQRNIHSFGGDPRKVTLFGSDAGSTMIMALMTNPDSESLFRSVWLTDPALYFNRTFTEASNYNHNNFLLRTNCPHIVCLYQLSAEDVLKAFIGDDDPSFVVKDQNDLPIQGMLNKQLIVIDDELVTAGLPFPPNTSIDIPVLIGSTIQAIEYWTGPKDLWKWSWSDYNKYVTTSLDSFGPRLTQMALMQYPATPTITPALQYLTMVSDLRQTCPVNQIVANMSTVLTSKVFRYLIQSKPSQSVTVFDNRSNNSFHFWDLIGFFGTIDKFIENPSDSDQQFGQQIRDIVFNFVRDGRPDSYIQLPVRWDQSFPHQLAIITSNETTVQNNYVISDRCEFWDTQGLTRYAWVS